MTEEEIENSIETNKLNLSTWGKITHYGIVIGLLCIPTAFLIFHIFELMNGTQKPIKEGEINAAIIATTLGLFSFIIQRKRLKFKSIETDLPRKELIEIIKTVSKDLEWMPYIKDQNLIVFKTHPSLLFGSWGEQITIIFDKNRVLVNSICDPDQRTSVTSMGRNSKNIKRLTYEIQKPNR